MATQMTRAEYEAKYGAKPVSSSPVKMTRAEYEAKYGNTQPDGNNMLQKFAQNTLIRPALRTGQAIGALAVEAFGNEQQKARIPQAISQPVKMPVFGTTQGQKAFGQGGGKQLAIDTGKSALDIATLGAGTAVNTGIRGVASQGLSAVAPNLAKTKVGGFVAKQLPRAIANAGEAVAYNTAYNALNEKPLKENLGTAAAIGVIAPPVISGIAKGTSKIVGSFRPEVKAQNLANKRLVELNKINKIKTLSNVVEKGRERGIDIPKLLSETDVLHGSVDKNGTITTKGIGNAIEEYTNKNIAGNEALVSESLKKEGRSIAPQIVQKKLNEAIDNAGIEGAALTQAKKKIADELAGYELRSQFSGAIPLETLHSAKIDKYNGINFFTEGATKKYDKTIAKALKELVEEYTTDINVKEVNKELSKHFAVIDYLERLDGRKVEGGRLGKYFARTVGAIVGGKLGPLGAVVGAEAGGLAKGAMMSRVFRGKTGKLPVQAKAITQAIEYNKKLPMQIPQSSKSLGNLKTSQSTTIIPTTTGIPKSVPQLPKKSSGLRSIPNRNAGFVATGGYKETGNLTTKILKDLEGKTTVSKQYILDATNRGELKQVERDLTREILDTMEGDTVNVKEFADKVKSELLPLKVSKNKDLYTGNNYGAKYENITLPSELRGNVKNYKENVYESPVKTSAGGVHFSEQNKSGYFGHTRIEDMADNKTRRVIEVQSDLYQKGRLEDSVPFETKTLPNEAKRLEEIQSELYKIGDNTSPKAKKLNAEKAEIRKTIDSRPDPKATNLAKLQQYNDPTAHFRMIREEIKKASQDGKTKLQFPTGETAMKIEGLGSQSDWVAVDFSQYNTPQRIVNRTTLKPDTLKVGMDIQQGGVTGGGQRWIITDVLGDGKFKAVPKYQLDFMSEDFSNLGLIGPDDTISAIAKGDKMVHDIINTAKEQFDISGKVDTNNPIYKFYEKDVAKYLNKFGGRRVVDDKGVSWIEIPITKDQGKAPVEAFGKAQPNVLLIGAGLSGAGVAGYAGYKKRKANLPKR